MIQRIQSVFLLLVIAGMTVFLFLPFWEKTDPASGNFVYFNPFMLKQVSPSGGEPVVLYYPYILCGIGAMAAIALAIFELLKFKNRLTQIKFGLANSIVMSLVLFFSAWLALKAQGHFLPEIKGAFKLGLFAPVFSMIFNSLANRFIKRDEDKVRAADRLR
jgi:hypothetical protein